MYSCRLQCCSQLVFLWVTAGCWSLSMAVMPQSQVTFYYHDHGGSNSNSDASITTTTFLASNALYGPRGPMVGKRTNSNNNDNDNRYPVVHLTDEDTDDLGFCQDDVSSSSSSHILGLLQDAIVLVPRGNCSYERKTWTAQQYGAKGVILYNTLASRYGYNETTLEITWPLSQHDYDCNNGMAYIPMEELELYSDANKQQPYFSALDARLSGRDEETNLCFKYATDGNNFINTCASKRCFLTGNTSTTNPDTWQACCAWDQHLYLFPDSDLHAANSQQDIVITIPTVMVTMEQGQDLLDQWKAAGADSSSNNHDSPLLYGSISSRWKLNFNLSALLIWILGVTVCAVASYHSASDYHLAIARRTDRVGRRNRRRHQRRPSDEDENDHQLVAPRPVPRSAIHDEQMELEPIHAIGFIAMASTSLIVLFYFEIYGVVKVFYAFGCTNAVVQIILVPKVERIFRMLRIPKRLIYQAQGEEPIIPDISNVDACAMAMGYVWGGLWLYLAFTLPHNTTTTFFWVSQNIFGACMCCLFLQIIQLNAIKVASVLLVVAFFYDIFFVFITPFLTKGGESIMITVATSGGPPTAGELWCEKYPSDPNCQGGDPLPMLLTMPRFFDYEGGSSLLGLGDIVLPGLLLSFAARLDAAKTLVAIAASRGEGGVTTATSTTGYAHSNVSKMGYFGPVVVGYGVGLLMANMAVYLMHMGQPALLYLVPCCLGTMTVLGYLRGELPQLWSGPKVLEDADTIAYGARSTTGAELSPSHTHNDDSNSNNNNYTDSNIGDGDGMDPGSISMTDHVDGGPTSNGIMVELSCQPSVLGAGDDDHDDDHDDELGRVPLLEPGNNPTNKNLHHQGSYLSSS